jgi:hypothetical protein
MLTYLREGSTYVLTMLGQNEEYHADFLLIMFSILVFFFICDAWFEKVHPSYGHVTGAALIVGMTFSLLYYWLHGENTVDY